MIIKSNIAPDCFNIYRLTETSINGRAATHAQLIATNHGPSVTHAEYTWLCMTPAQIATWPGWEIMDDNGEQ